MCPHAEMTLEKGILLEKEAHFKQAKTVYEDILQHAADETLLEKVRLRIEDMDDLIAEKTIYQRIDENAKRVLTEIGINIAENQTLMDILLEADAIDFDSETALFIPLKRNAMSIIAWNWCPVKCREIRGGIPSAPVQRHPFSNGLVKKSCVPLIAGNMRKSSVWWLNIKMLSIFSACR
jgi:hypothetical protein